MKWILFFLIILSPLQLNAKITKDDVLKVAIDTQKRIESIKSYRFLLVKREFVDGRDTGYQYMNVKVNVDPLKIYIKFLKPRKLIGREALYLDGDLICRRGGLFTPSLVLILDPKSPVAMEGNRYSITHINPKEIVNTLINKIKKEVEFDHTELFKYIGASVYGHKGTHYRLVHAVREEGQECKTADVIVSDTLQIPIYFKVVDWNDRVIEEYAFQNMELNITFNNEEFDRNNPEYMLKDEKKNENL